MKKIPLLPSYFRWIGLILILIAVLLYAYDAFYESTEFYIRTFVVINDTPLSEKGFMKLMKVDIFLTLLLLSLLLGLGLIAFSRSRKEDEMINSLRLYSWSWAVILTLSLGILMTVFVFGASFIAFAFLFGHLLLLMYIAIFNYNLFKLNRTHEE